MIATKVYVLPNICVFADKPTAFLPFEIAMAAEVTVSLASTNIAVSSARMSPNFGSWSYSRRNYILRWVKSAWHTPTILYIKAGRCKGDRDLRQPLLACHIQVQVHTPALNRGTHCNGNVGTVNYACSNMPTHGHVTNRWQQPLP